MSRSISPWLGSCFLLLAGLSQLACDTEFRAAFGNQAKKDSSLNAPQPLPGVPTPAGSAYAGGTVYPAGSGTAITGTLPPSTFAELAERANPAVVFVKVLVETQRGFRRVLAGGTGSGFIFDPNGLILTNYHVVDRSRAIAVDLIDGRSLEAKLVGADPLTDLAVLRIDAQGLPVLPLGDSEQLRVGDWVLAIGNPFGLSHTVSAGIISAKERTGEEVEMNDPRAYYSFLQTDASINPGNSGGPLLDLSGRVIGINTAINPQANSIGFAIPVNMVRELLPRLLKDGIIRRAALGVQVSDGKPGALLAGLLPGGPAEAAGLREGDKVIEVAHTVVKNAEQLRYRVSLLPIGAPSALLIERNGKRSEVQVTPVEMARR